MEGHLVEVEECGEPKPRMPSPVEAALRYLDYCSARQQPFPYAETPRDIQTLDLDEMRTREAALQMLTRYFNQFEHDCVAEVFDAAIERVREAERLVQNPPVEAD